MLFLRDRIEESVQILRQFEPPDGYYLAFSGGKDSVVLYAMAELAGVKFDSHYNVTTADPPELVRFIRDYYPSVKMERSGWTMWTLIPKKLMPPTRKVRYCCDFLKERGGVGRTVLTGVKRSDSVNRRNRLVVNCYKKNTTGINPLLYWCDDEIWAFIKENNLPYCSLYDEGRTRIGCIGCPFARAAKQKADFERWPKYRAMYIRAFEQMLKERIRKGKATNWKNGEEVMAWWLNEQDGLADNDEGKDAPLNFEE